MDTEYILRIILKARDEIAKVLARARSEMAAFRQEVNKTDSDLGKLNSRITSLNTRVGNVTNKIEEWRAAMRGFGKDSDDTADSQDAVTKSTDNLIVKSRAAIKSNQDLAREFKNLRSELRDLNREYDEGDRSRQDAVFGFDRIGKALDRLSRQTKIGSEISYDIQALAREAKGAGQAIVDEDKRIASERVKIEKDRIDRVEKAKQDELANNARIASEREAQLEKESQLEIEAARDRARERARQEREAERAEKQAQNEKERRTAAFYRELLTMVNDREREQDANIIAIHREETERDIRLEQERQTVKAKAYADDIAARRKHIADMQKLQARGDKATEGFRDFVAELDKGQKNLDEARATLKDYARDFDSLRGEYEKGSDAADHFSNMAARARDILRDNEGTVNQNSNAFRRMFSEVGKTGDNIASLDNRLRGIGLLLVFGFAQQLTTALAGLGGEFVALASSAFMAAGAIGGSFLAGIAQSIPMVALLVGAFQRVGSVMDAVNQADKLQQQQFVQRESAGRKLADTTDAVANANDTLSNANERVKESHERLNDAVKQAALDLEDLIFKQKEAELAAKGAALAQKDAQEALRLAVARGDTAGIESAELRVSDSRLKNEQAITNLKRVRGEVRTARAGQTENVEQARKSLDDAEEGVERARRGLEGARRNTQEAAAGSMNAAATLQYFISQLSPAERKLFEALQRIKATYRREWRPITDIIIDSFSRTVNRINRVIQMPTVLAEARKSSRAISREMNRIVDSFTSKKIIDQMLRIVKAGRENLPGITSILTNLGKAFLNLAEFANPAFEDLIGYTKELSERFQDVSANGEGVTEFFQEGERHLESWIELAVSVIRLFAALSGAGGAESGLTSIRDATKEIDNLTTKVNDNASDVGKFFEDARRVTYQIVRVITALGVEILKSFDPGRAEHFADFLVEVVIPAIGEVIRNVGAITSAIADFLSQPVIRDLAKWGLVILALGQTTASTVGAMSYFGRMLRHVGGAATAALSPFAIMAEKMGLIRKAANDSDGAVRRLASGLGRLLERIPGMRNFGSALRNWGDAPLKTGQATAGRYGASGTGAPVIIGPNGRPIDPDDPRRRPPTTPRSRFGGMAGAAGAGTLAAFGGAAGLALAAVPVIIVAGQGNKARREAEAEAVGTRAERRFSEISRTDPQRLNELDFVFNVDKGKSQKGLKEWQEVMKRFGAEGEKETQAVIDALEKVRDRTGKIIEGLSDNARKFVRRNKLSVDDIVDPNAVSQFQSNLTRLNRAGVGSIKELRSNIRFNLDQINKGFKQGSEGWLQAISENMEGSVEAIARGMKEGKIKQGDGLREIRRITRQQMALVRDNIDTMSQQAKDSIAGNFRDARLAIERQTGGWRKATGDALREIRSLMRKELEIYGLSPAQARTIARNNDGGRAGQYGAVAGGGNEGGFRRAVGGVLGNWGERGADLFNTWIGRGEVVLNSFQQAAMNALLPGQNTVRTVVEGVKGFHAGGPESIGFAGGYAGKSPSGNRTVPIPGFPGEFIASKVLQDALSLIKRFNLFVTDAFARTGHEGAGHLQTGTAVDVIPGPRGSWDKVDDAVAYARAKGMTVLYNGVAGHGRGHHAHIELVKGAVGAVRTANQVLRRLAKISVAGPDSPLKNISTAVTHTAKGAAGRLLRVAAEQSGASPEGMEDVKPMSADTDVVSAFRRAIRRTGSRGRSSLALWMAGIVESGLRNLLGGDRDSEGALQLRVGLHGRALARNPFAAAVAFLTRGFTGQGGAIDIASANPKMTAGNVAQAVQGSGYPAKYDEVAAQARRYMSFARGGEIPGDEGSPIGILAHAGEWIVNRFQQSRLANMLGMGRDGLRSLLGFHGKGGAAGFAGGAEVDFNRDQRRNVARSDFTEARLRAIRKQADDVLAALGSFELSDDAFRSVSSVLRDFGKVMRSIRGLSRTTKSLTPFFGLIDATTREGGILDQLRTAIEQRVARAARRLARGRFSVGAGRVVTERMDDVETANQTLADERMERGLLLDERRAIQRELDMVQRRQRKKGLTESQRRKLQAAENNLRERLNASVDAINQNVADIFDAQAAAAQAIVDRRNAAVEEVNARFEAESGGLELGRRFAQALGNTGMLKAINQAQQNLLARQANELQGQAWAAHLEGNEELRGTLEAQVNDLRTQIFEITQQIIRDNVDAVNQVASRKLGRLDLFSRMADAMGSVGLGGLATLGGETFSRASLLQQRGDVLREQQGGLQGQLREAERQGNMGLVQELTDQLAELSVAIQENTRAAFTARIDEVNRVSSFGLNINDLNKQILELQGSISGAVDQEAILASAREREQILRTQRAGLEGLLSEARASGDQQAINDLTTAILENEIALLQNTQAVNELTGSTKTQSFTSTAWQWFRNAIFNGSGGLLQRYQVPVPMMDTGGEVLTGGMAILHPREIVKPATINRNVATSETPVFAPHIENHEKTVDMNADELSNKLWFRYQTRPTQ